LSAQLEQQQDCYQSLEARLGSLEAQVARLSAIVGNNHNSRDRMVRYVLLAVVLGGALVAGLNTLLTKILGML